MKKVNTNFIFYRWIEIVLLITGLIITFTCRNNPGKQFLLGLGIALTIEAALMLGADFFAEKRANDYTKKLETYINRR